MMNYIFRRVITAIIIGLFFMLAKAHASECPSGQVGTSYGYYGSTLPGGSGYPSLSAAQSAALSAINAQGYNKYTTNGGSIQGTNWTLAPGQGSINGTDAYYQYYGSSYGQFQASTFAATCAAAPPPPTCTTDIVKSFNGTNSTATPSPSVCNAGCNYKYDTGSTASANNAKEIGLTIDMSPNPSNHLWVGAYKSDGTTCGTDTATVATNPNSITDGTNTATVDGKNANGQKCGSVNGQQVCLGTIANDTCVKNAAGYGFCATTMPTDKTVPDPSTPPAPNNGTKGTPAARLVVFIDKENNLLASVYLPAAVSGSTQGLNQGDTKGTGVGAPGTGNSGTGGGKEGCKSGSDCVDQKEKPGTYKGAGLPDDGSITSSYQDFYTRIKSSPLASSFTAFNSGIPTSGSAPTASFNALNHTFTIDTGPIFNAAATTLRAIFLCLFALSSVILFFKA